eukprot:Gb_06639 [translate_table: standard]
MDPKFALVFGICVLAVLVLSPAAAGRDEAAHEEVEVVGADAHMGVALDNAAAAATAEAIERQPICMDQIKYYY